MGNASCSYWLAATWLGLLHLDGLPTKTRTPFVWPDETNPKVGLNPTWLGRISTRWTRPIRRKLRALALTVLYSKVSLTAQVRQVCLSNSRLSKSTLTAKGEFMIDGWMDWWMDGRQLRNWNEEGNTAMWEKNHNWTTAAVKRIVGYLWSFWKGIVGYFWSFWK